MQGTLELKLDSQSVKAAVHLLSQAGFRFDEDFTVVYGPTYENEDGVMCWPLLGIRFLHSSLPTNVEMIELLENRDLTTVELDEEEA